MASCDGCQLTLLDLEDELLALAERFEIVEFPEATSLRSAGPYDVLLVEGSVSTPEQAEEMRRAAPPGEAPRHHRRLRQLRRDPGAPQLVRPRRVPRAPSTPTRSTSSRSPRPRRCPSTSRSTLELHGCPISPEQLREVLVSRRRRPPPADPRRGGLPRVQAAGRRVRDGRAGHAVPRPGHPERLRRAVPDLRPRLLRLLRPARAGQRREPRTHVRDGSDARARTSAGCSRGSPAGRRPFRAVIAEYGGPPGRTPSPSPRAAATKEGGR